MRWPLSPNEGNSHFDLAVAARLGEQREIVRRRALGGVVERHEAFLVAFAAHHDDAGVMARGGCRQRDEFGDAQAGRVEHLDQAGEPRRAQPHGQWRRRIADRRHPQQAIDFGRA